ncbi:MFS transporter [Kitasatospora sp. CB02891]|uniref:MFS transporter n=1 Tax=Kitasatospora sp. CB02891 TaxID=2020329 RepID=UPI000C27B6A8|nr:MFS transporter [Kitasatospora sp. CB02891]PJN22102.1 MFS transporter [Kitasatospora sp. CB02891]
MTTQQAGVWRRMRLWGAAHAVDDLYQGLVPAVVPYFVLERGYGYVAAGGLTLAATLGSAVPQPLVGLLVDRRPLPWLSAAGLALAGLGVGLSGLADGYALVWLLVLLSGLGVAAFHPAAGRAAREAAGDSAGAMSVFAAGGSVGFFLAPVLATPLLTAWGVRATAVFVLPALAMAAVLFRARHRRPGGPGSSAVRAGKDRWRPFLVLTGVEIVRSVAFFGVSTFIELYWLRHLGASHLLAGAALTCFLLGGVVGTLGGGRLADRIGMVRTAQWGTALTAPALILLRVTPGPWAPLLFAALAGAMLNLPFAVLVKLGQDYLPTRPGTAAGVTLGLAVSVGGLLAPLLGLIARSHGPEGVLAVLPAVPVAGVLLGMFMVEPDNRAGGPETGESATEGRVGAPPGPPGPGENCAKREAPTGRIAG